MQFLHVSSEGRTTEYKSDMALAASSMCQSRDLMTHVLRRATASLVLVRTVDTENFGLGRGTRYTKGHERMSNFCL